MPDLFGIDISKWNGDMNIQSAVTADGVQFVIIKAGGSDDGLYIDSQFVNSYNKCKAAGVPCGLYWYTKAASVAALHDEVNYLLSYISGMQFELPLYLDIEESSTFDYSDQLAMAWIQDLVARRYYPGIYSGYYWYLDKLTDPLIGQYSVWLAYWASSLPTPFPHTVDCWQYSENGYIAGVTTDLDRLYTDYSFIITQGWNNWNGTPTYTIRNTDPAGSGSPFYNTVGSGGYNTSIIGNGAISGANVMNNCVGYSQGRMMEMYSEAVSPITSAADNIFSMFNANAEDWYNIAVANNFAVGQTPTYGAVGVWYSAAQNVGHVANVETLNNGVWEISEGHYNYPGGQGSWDYSYLQNNSDYLPAFIGADPTWVLIGFIYPFNAVPPTPPGPPVPPSPGRTRKMKLWFYLKRLPF